MAYTLRINPKAHQDIRAICEYILKDGEGIAKEQAELIYKGLEKLAVFPGIGGELAKKFGIETDYRHTQKTDFVIVTQGSRTQSLLAFSPRFCILWAFLPIFRNI